MLTVIPIKNLLKQTFISEIENNSNIKLSRIPITKTTQIFSNCDIIISNYYIETIVFMLYYIDIVEYPIVITLPSGGILFKNLSSIPFIQALVKLFSNLYAWTDENDVAYKIQVKALSTQTINAVNDLERLNRINPLIKLLFKNMKSRSDKNTVCAYEILKKHDLLHDFTNLQKYFLWECRMNNNTFGTPIGALTIDFFESESIQQFVSVFGNAYVIGSGNPWYSTHLIIKLKDFDILEKPFDNIFI